MPVALLEAAALGEAPPGVAVLDGVRRGVAQCCPPERALKRLDRGCLRVVRWDEPQLASCLRLKLSRDIPLTRVFSSI